MRSYLPDSPDAVARIIALTMIADGHACRSELDVVELAQAGGSDDLGIARAHLLGITRDFCEDLRACSNLSWSETCRMDQHTTGALLAEIADPALRRQLAGLCRAVAGADRQLSAEESWLLALMDAQWGLRRDLPAS